MREVVSPAGKRVKVRSAGGGAVSDLLMLGSNNYLGLANEPAVVSGAIDALRTFGAGCGGPPLLNGMTTLHRTLERRLAEHKQCEDAMIFSSGYAANVGWITGLLAPGDVLVFDEQSHASVVDGIKQGRVRSRAYLHNDAEAAERALVKARESQENATLVLCTEGVFSMDGDVAPLGELAKRCRSHDALLVIDDAHGTGVLGPSGQGTPAHFGLAGEVDVVMGTFSKVFATTGGFIAGRADLIEYLRYFARSYMFSAAVPPPVLGTVLAGLDYMESHPERVSQLHTNVRYLVDGLRAEGFDVASESAIVPLLLPEHVALQQVVMRLHDEGLFVNGVAYPAVPKGQERLRLSVMATFTRSDLDLAIAKLTKVARELAFLSKEAGR
ncbi:MAG: aminotransferase class I/II-fold pyridoxal phosphate-dependent enzyme [Solirubrobacterales bacterium]|nr:aminotransferase class I/II-fold pyridoxal phosphate-dependent enzyme [Solirubrobacterales bacterium]